MSIEVQQINKTFGTYKALNNVSLTVNTGELIALLGPSGSGKTTLLRIIAGLETAESGEILFHGDDAKNKKTKDRNVGFVFQHYALFRHMTVFQNIAFGLEVKPKGIRPGKEAIKNKVQELLKLVQLDWVADRYPSQLSGGQRQRIALARALAIEPKVLLLDEPFGSLDARVRKELRQWLRRFHDDLHITTLFVTHDQEEALEVADKIVVMNEGRIEQTGSPEEVYHNPASVFVLNFLGNVNIFHARSEGDALPGNSKQKKIYVRPHQLAVSRLSTSADSVRVRIVFVNPAGSVVKIDARSEEGEVYQIEISQEEFKTLKLVKNDEVFLTPKNITYSEYDI
ncbi:MAG: sulfate/molybdate ABC transporter ATP-binding protein [Candidatus Omnitrophota bacterium]